MNTIKFHILHGLLLTCTLCGLYKPLSARTSAEALQAHLKERVSRDVSQGIVVGIITFNGTQFFQAGTYSETDERPVGPNTLFEIGPVTQLFTASATAVLVEEKQFSWRSAINPLLPQAANPPTWEGQSMRVFDLLTHSAALPKFPLNLDPKTNRSNPYANFTQKDLYTAISKARFPYPPGQRYLYSNYGYAILGHALELRTAKPYETILQETIVRPLNLKNTTTELTAEQREQLAPGHFGLAPTENWDYNAMTGDGGVYTTPKDLLQFLAAHLGLIKSPLTTTLKPLQAKYLNTKIEKTQMGYAWHITQKGDDPVHWLSGITGGYSAFVGMNILQKKGVIVLSNTSEGIDEIGFNLLAPSDYPLVELPKLYSITAKQLENYTGNYQITPNIFLEITRKGDRLYAQFTGEPKFRIYPRSEKTFEYAQGHRTLTFDTERGGTADSITVIENFKSIEATRAQ